ncbi:MAG: hypothetical protein H8D87_02350 [Deltaproteobacteria bacterium]|nr:hypothetical protein [Candidatus Desulfobacula maris]
MKTLEELLRMRLRTRNGIEFTPDFRVAVQTPKEGGQHILIHQMQSDRSDLTLEFIVKNNQLIPYKTAR